MSAWLPIERPAKTRRSFTHNMPIVSDWRLEEFTCRRFQFILIHAALDVQSRNVLFKIFWKYKKYRLGIWNIPWDSSNSCSVKLAVGKWLWHWLNQMPYDCIQRNPCFQRRMLAYAYQPRHSRLASVRYANITLKNTFTWNRLTYQSFKFSCRENSRSFRARYIIYQKGKKIKYKIITLNY